MEQGLLPSPRQRWVAGYEPSWPLSLTLLATNCWDWRCCWCRCHWQLWRIFRKFFLFQFVSYYYFIRRIVAGAPLIIHILRFSLSFRLLCEIFPTVICLLLLAFQTFNCPQERCGTATIKFRKMPVIFQFPGQISIGNCPLPSLRHGISQSSLNFGWNLRIQPRCATDVSVGKYRAGSGRVLIELVESDWAGPAFNNYSNLNFSLNFSFGFSLSSTCAWVVKPVSSSWFLWPTSGAILCRGAGFLPLTLIFSKLTLTGFTMRKRISDGPFPFGLETNSKWNQTNKQTIHYYFRKPSSVRYSGSSLSASIYENFPSNFFSTHNKKLRWSYLWSCFFHTFFLS